MIPEIYGILVDINSLASPFENISFNFISRAFNAVAYMFNAVAYMLAKKTLMSFVNFST